MTIKKKENRGGAREGAGRPPKPSRELSDYFKRGILRSIKKKQKETGKSPFDIYADLLYSPHTQAAVKSSLLKLFADIMVEKPTTVNNNDNRTQSVIMLPNTQATPETPKALIDVEKVK